MDVQDIPQTPPAETIDLASMTVEHSYDGPHLQGQPTYGVCTVWETYASSAIRLDACMTPSAAHATETA